MVGVLKIYRINFNCHQTRGIQWTKVSLDSLQCAGFLCIKTPCYSPYIHVTVLPDIPVEENLFINIRAQILTLL